MKLTYRFLRAKNLLRIVISAISCLFLSLPIMAQPDYQAKLDSCVALVVTNPANVIKTMNNLLEEDNEEVKKIQFGQAHYLLGAAHYQLNEQDLSVYHFSKAADVFRSIDENVWLGKTFTNLGLAYRDDNEFVKALNYLDKAFAIYLEGNHLEKQIEVMLLTGGVYSKQNDFENAVNHLNKAINLSKIHKKDSLLAKAHGNLTLIYRDKGALEDALKNEFIALQLHNKLNDKTSLAASHNMIGSIYWRLNKFPEAEKAYSEAIKLYKTQELQIQQAKTIENLARVYKDWQFVNKADSITQLAIQLYKQNNDSMGVASANKNLGNIYYEKNNLIKAMHHYLLALKTYEQVNDVGGIVDIRKNLGNIYMQIGEFEKAMDYYHIALDREIQENNISGSAYIENLIGNCYSELKNFDEALNSYQTALKKYKELDHNKNIASTINHIGNVYLQQSDYGKALKKYQESMEYARIAGDDWRVSTEWNNIGNVYLATNMPHKAMDAFKSGYEINRKIKNLYGTALCSRKIGELYFQNNNNDSAAFYLEQSLKLGSEIDNKELMKNASYALYNFYNKEENYKKALENYQTYAVLSDSIEKKTNRNYIAEMQLSQLILEKEDLVNEYLNDREILLADNKLKEIQLIRKNAIQKILLVAILASLIILLLFLNRYRLKQKHANQLNEQIRVIKDTNNALADSEAQLLTLNATKDKFFSVLAHDLKNPLTGIVTASTTLQNNYENFEQEQRKGFIEIINASARQLENLLTNLLHWSKTQTGRSHCDPVTFNLKAVTEEVFKVSEINASKKEITLTHQLAGDEYLLADKEMITTVIRNLISNAIKYSNPEGMVEVKATLSEDVYVISVIDGGVGISQGNLRKLFKFDQKVSTYGTNDEAGSGLGLILSKEFVEKNGGKIWVEKTSNKGTTFKFTVPKSSIA